MDRGHGSDALALIIEDDMMLRATLAELLVDEGFAKVIQASNGFSGLRLAIEHHPSLLLLDLHLPELSGEEVLRELRGSGAREMAIVVVTGSPEQLSETQVAETDGVIRKPFDLQSLLLTVHAAMQRAASRAAEVAPVATPASPLAAAHRRGSRSLPAGAARRARGRR